jgi:signal transduction histidine kinase
LSSPDGSKNSTSSKSSAHLDAIISSLVTGFVLQDDKGGIIDFNPAALEILGLTSDQLLGRTSMDPRWKSIHQDGSPFPGSEHPAMLALKTGLNQKNVIMGIEQPNAARRWIKINSVPLSTQRSPSQRRPDQVISTFDDVTELVNLNQALSKLKERHEVAVRSVTFCLWEWNLKTGTVVWDENMYELMEIDHDKFSPDYDNFFRSILPEDTEKLKNVMSLAFSEKEQNVRSAFRIKTKAGTIKYIEFYAECFYDNEGNILRVVGSDWDVSNSIQQEIENETQRTRLKEASKMATLGEMAGGIAHEINNPLTIIQNLSTRISKILHRNSNGPMKTKTLEEAFKHLDTITSTCDRISQIIKGLRSFSRNADRDPFALMPLKDILIETIELCRERFCLSGIDFRIATIPDLTISTRSCQISQVLLNLLNNSYDAIKAQEEKWIELGISQVNENLIELSITDSGHGIPKEIAEKIMKPFFTTKPIGKGTGLGLSISKEIIEAHSGTIALDDSSPHTRFVIRLPLFTESQKKSA